MRVPAVLFVAVSVLVLGACDKLSPSAKSGTGGGTGTSAQSGAAPVPAAAPTSGSGATTSGVVGTPGTPVANPQLIKVYAKADGTLLVDGRPTTIDFLETQLIAVAKAGGECWYARDNPKSDPHPIAERVLTLVVKHNVRLSISTKPDFSDVLDAEGNVHPR